MYCREKWEKLKSGQLPSRRCQSVGGAWERAGGEGAGAQGARGKDDASAKPPAGLFDGWLYLGLSVAVNVFVQGLL